MSCAFRPASVLSRVIPAAVALGLAATTVEAHPSWSIVRDKARGLVYYSDLRQVFVINSKLERRVAVPDVHTHELRIDEQGRLFGEDAKVNGRHRVWRLDPDGRLVDIIPDQAGFRDDWGFVADGAGRLYWAKCQNNAPGGPFCVVKRRAKEGRIEVAAGGARFAHPLNFLAPATDGAVLVADGPDVKKIQDGAAPTVLFSSLTRAKDRFAIMGFHQETDGAVVAAAFGDGEIVRVTPTGVKSVLAKSPAPWAPTGVLRTESGLWILEFDGARARLRFLDKAGRETAFPVSP